VIRSAEKHPLSFIGKLTTICHIDRMLSIIKNDDMLFLCDITAGAALPTVVLNDDF
jgi:hypothetical protein